MAQSKSFFGLRRGSTKSLTFSTFNGKQVTKDRVSDVKNPRTQDQMINRMINYTAMKAYSSMKAIVDHSFASKSYGLQSMRYFLAKNYALLKNNKESMAFSSYKGNAVPTSFLVSEGSLPSPNWSKGSENTSIEIVPGGKSIGDLKKYLGLSANDYITFVWLSTDDLHNFCWVRLYMPSDDKNNEIISLDLLNVEKNIDEDSAINVENDGETNKKIVLSPYVEEYASGAIIASAKKGDIWQRSTEYLQDWGPSHFSNYDKALATYPVGASYILNGGDK